MKLSEALEVLTKTYKSLDAVASGLQVDAKEVNDALNKADVDSAEYVALKALEKFNPYKSQEQFKTKAKQDDSADKIE